jgi:alkylation response protein AidB-like acyl-CoA dehydrogenase
MKLALTAADATFQAEMRNFFTSRIPLRTREKGLAGEPLERHELVEAVRIMNAACLAVPHWPVRWGGRDWTPLQRHIWLTEMQLAGVPKPLPFNMTMIGPVIANFGSEEMGHRFLPATANLDIWWAQGFSEPEAGSDLASLRTTAVRDGNDFLVTGQKTWTSYAQHADWIFCLVRTDPSVRKQAGISILLIDLATPGITVRPIRLVDGAHEVNEVFFDGVRVPAHHLVGEENMGWTYAKFLLVYERTGAAPLGAIKRTLARAKNIAEQTRSRRSPVESVFIDRRVALLENELLALELTAVRVTGSTGRAADSVASLLKLRGTELQQDVAELVLDLSQENGFTGRRTKTEDWEGLAMPHYLNTRKTTIYGGSSEVQRTIIADSILGLGK